MEKCNMTKIEILGTGCSKCKKLAEITERAAKETGIEFTLDKVEDINLILKYGVMMTPALVVNGEIKAVGRLPRPEEIKSFLLQGEVK
jgi:small redox-active disulfide protein 2